MKKVVYAILIFLSLRILIILFSGGFLELISGLQSGSLIIFSIIPLFTGCFPFWDSWSCGWTEPYLSLILFLGILFSVYSFARLTIFIKNKEIIVKIVNYTLLTFWVLIIGYSIFLLVSVFDTTGQNCGSLPYEEARRDCYLMKILETPLDEIKQTDTEYCEKSSDQDICYEMIAQKLNDPSVCNNIKDSFSRDCCYLLEKTALAAEEKDDKICDDLRDTYEKDKNNIMGNHCYKLYHYVNLCYQKVAIAKNDENYCERINLDYIGTHTEKLLECYSVIAKNKNDSEICGKMAGKEYMDARIPLCVEYVNK